MTKQKFKYGSLSLSVLFLVLTFQACSQRRTGANYQQQLQNYQAVLDSMAKYSVIYQGHDISELREDLIDFIGEDSTEGNIQMWMFKEWRKEDPHSVYLTKEQRIKIRRADSSFVPDPYPFKASMDSNSIVYLSLDRFIALDTPICNRYADSLQNLLLHFQKQNPTGWILDMRKNTGGWVFPMISGVGPLLGKGLLAQEITKFKDTFNYYYWWEEQTDYPYLELVDSPWVVSKEVPLAILVNQSTASAGELITICTRQRVNSKVFGSPTRAHTTGLKTIELPDSSIFWISHSYFYDRTQQIYKNGVRPDHEVSEADLIKEASKWILEKQID